MIQVIDNSTSNLDDLLTKYPKCDHFIIMPGTYNLTKPLKITRPNVRIIGYSNDANRVKIIQQNVLDGIVINANNTTIKNITVEVNKNEEVICVTHYDCNWTNISNCVFNGSDIYFTIYYAGPSELEIGQDTIQGYLDGVFDKYNIFENNIINSKWDGDGVAFSLQSEGSVRYNLLRGCKLAIYMCDKSVVSHNTVIDSTSKGIFVSLPSSDLMISDNRLLNCEKGGINIRLQLEHGEYINYDHDIVIKNNEIGKTNYMGIELNYSDQVTVTNNTINDCVSYGVYGLNVTSSEVSNNNILLCHRGIFMDGSNNNNIENNRIVSIKSDHAIALNDSSINEVKNNRFVGRFSSVYINEFGDSTNNSYINNERERFNSKIYKINSSI